MGTSIDGYQLHRFKYLWIRRSKGSSTLYRFHFITLVVLVAKSVSFCIFLLSRRTKCAGNQPACQMVTNRMLTGSRSFYFLLTFSFFSVVCRLLPTSSVQYKCKGRNTCAASVIMTVKVPVMGTWGHYLQSSLIAMVSGIRRGGGGKHVSPADIRDTI